MAEGTYEYECMRAELLGVEKPDYEEFMRRTANEKKDVEEEELDIENLKDTDLRDESNKRILSGLEELNSILQKTQTKINRFKVSCGSLTNLLKIKVGGKGDSSSSINDVATPSATASENVVESAVEDAASPQNEPKSTNGEEGSTQRKSDLSKALDKDLSRLDTMIQKAEDAQYSMENQRKQMKRFLN